MPIQPYLFFEGRADEAIEFYKKALGAKVEMLMRFKEAPDQSMISPGSGEKVMHAALKIGDATVLMSDGRNTGKPNFQGISLTLYAKDAAGSRQSCSARWPKAARCACRWTRPSSRQASACSPTSSASAGW